MKEYRFHKAEKKDLELLVATRLEVLRAANCLNDTADLRVIEQASREYYSKSFRDGSHVAYFVFDGEKLAGTGGVSFYQVMPTVHNPSGMKAYLMNLYTRQPYRRHGIAEEMLKTLIGEAKNRGVSFITLEATAAGRPLYERCGFLPMQDEMQYFD